VRTRRDRGRTLSLSGPRAQCKAGTAPRLPVQTQCAPESHLAKGEGGGGVTRKLRGREGMRKRSAGSGWEPYGLAPPVLWRCCCDGCAHDWLRVPSTKQMDVLKTVQHDE